MAVREKDHGSDALIRKLGLDAQLKIGILGNDASQEKTDPDGEGSPLTVAEVAERHEFGIGVPRRSFIRDWYDENESSNRAIINKIPKQVVKGSPLRMLLEQVGLVFVGDIKKRIKAGINRPLSEMAIRLRKDRGNTDDTPLIDTGQLWSSITHLVEVQ